MNWLALIGQIAGAAAGEAASSMDKAQVMALIQSVRDEYGKIDVPQLQKLLLEKQGESRLGSIKDDPTYRAQQNAADAQNNAIINSGGLTLADRGALNAIREKVARTESAGRHAIEQSMAARGSLDSGAQLAMQLQNQQQGAESANAAGEDIAGRAQARAFEAVRDRARNAGAGLDRDYRQKSDAARANDAIEAGNVAIANTAARYNANLPQQDFQNKMALAGAKTQPTYALAGAKAANAKDTQQMWQGVGNAAGAAASSGYEQYKAAKQAPPSNSTGGGWSDDTGGADFGSNPNALSGTPTRKVVGHRLDGSPIYSEEMR